MERVIDEPVNPDVSSPLKTADAHDEDVVITATGFKERGRPTVLAKHSANTSAEPAFSAGS